MTLSLDNDQTIQISETFGLLSDPTRLSIVLKCGEGEISSGELASALSLTPSLASHHLRLLKAAGLVRSERRGKQVFYVLADQCVRNILDIMVDHVLEHDHAHD